MKVLFLNDYTLEQWLGGAQVEILWFSEVGRQKGHECKFITPENYSRDEVAAADLIVFNNIARFKVKEINWIAKQKPFITWAHDYTLAHWTLKSSEGIRPEEIAFYIQHPSAITEAKKACALYLLKNSLCNIFLSPLHAREYWKCANLKEAINLIMASPFNVDLFQDLKLDRDIDFLFAGRLSPSKGILNLLITARSCPTKNFYFAGAGPVERIMRKNAGYNCTFLGEVPYAKMPELFSRAKFFIFLPTWNDPFAHVVVQAKLCNCSLIINQNVGAASYSWFYEETEKMRKILRAIPGKGWDTIGELYEQNHAH